MMVMMVTKMSMNGDGEERERDTRRLLWFMNRDLVVVKTILVKLFLNALQSHNTQELFFFSI